MGFETGEARRTLAMSQRRLGRFFALAVLRASAPPADPGLWRRVQYGLERLHRSTPATFCSLWAAPSWTLTARCWTHACRAPWALETRCAREGGPAGVVGRMRGETMCWREREG